MTLVNVSWYYSFWEQLTSGYFSLDLLIYKKNSIMCGGVVALRRLLSSGCRSASFSDDVLYVRLEFYNDKLGARCWYTETIM